MATTLNSLAEFYQDQGRYADAEPLYKRILAIHGTAPHSEHSFEVTLTALKGLARLAFSRSDWAGAVDNWRRSTAMFRRRAERGVDARRRDGSGGVLFFDLQALSFIWASYRLAAQDGEPARAALAAETFLTTQWASGSNAAASLAQMAARSAAVPELAALVRQRQDLVGEWQAKDRLLIAAKSAEPAKRNPQAEKALADSLADIDTRLAEIERRLAHDFPDYAALARPAPLTVAEVQAQLRADEALVLFLDVPEWDFAGTTPLSEESFIWIFKTAVLASANHLRNSVSRDTYVGLHRSRVSPRRSSVGRESGRRTIVTDLSKRASHSVSRMGGTTATCLWQGML